jgi:hypothetical protein
VLAKKSCIRFGASGGEQMKAALELGSSARPHALLAVSHSGARAFAFADESLTIAGGDGVSREQVGAKFYTQSVDFRLSRQASAEIVENAALAEFEEKG